MIVVGFKKISEEICQSVVFYTMERILKSRTGAGFRLTSLTGLDVPNYLLTNKSKLSINFLEVYLVATWFKFGKRTIEKIWPESANVDGQEIFVEECKGRPKKVFEDYHPTIPPYCQLWNPFWSAPWISILLSYLKEKEKKIAESLNLKKTRKTQWVSKKKYFWFKNIFIRWGSSWSKPSDFLLLDEKIINVPRLAYAYHAMSLKMADLLWYQILR